ncbi:hypothetical protein M6D93_16985 [Jatrophihabitans telluris]|uniref:Uncharacterized protein n=1 Tax=Jatrophihabitans telluris TaxID=2038343 RepID=A0ABY4QWB7_9ACTN|nr:hypothetical protein [Jatrophihabitans telluris]UQX87978.1 hypothetical protein M6D93_16985 [Jatrophihabitans telluris]
MSEPLLSEGTDLAQIIADIRAEHGDAATIIYHDCVRRGGVGGFFAREVHRVAYRIAADGAFASDSATTESGSTDFAPSENWTTDFSLPHSPDMTEETAAVDSFEALLAAADAAENQVSSGGHAFTESSRDEFAALLRSALANPTSPGDAADDAVAHTVHDGQDASDFEPVTIISGRQVAPFIPPAIDRNTASLVTTTHPVAPAAQPVASAAAIAAASSGRHRAAHQAENENVQDTETGQPQAEHTATPRVRLASVPAPLASVTELVSETDKGRRQVLAQLAELGVPADIADEVPGNHIYEAVQNLLGLIPAAPSLPRRAGDVIAIVGELTPALRTAAAVAAQLRIPESSILIGGLAGHPAAALFEATEESRARLISGVGQARVLRSELRTRDVASVVVVATDTVELEPDDPWAAEMLEALQPTTSWLVLDSNAKVGDAQAELLRLGGIDSVALYSARASKSPASAFALGLPVTMIDGRTANAGAWASMMFAALPQLSAGSDTGQSAVSDSATPGASSSPAPSAGRRAAAHGSH